MSFEVLLHQNRLSFSYFFVVFLNLNFLWVDVHISKIYVRHRIEDSLPEVVRGREEGSVPGFVRQHHIRDDRICLFSDPNLTKGLVS